MPSIDSNETIDVEYQTLPYAEEDWNETEHDEAPKNTETVLFFGYRHNIVAGENPSRKLIFMERTLC